MRGLSPLFEVRAGNVPVVDTDQAVVDLLAIKEEQYLSKTHVQMTSSGWNR